MIDKEVYGQIIKEIKAIEEPYENCIDITGPEVMDIIHYLLCNEFIALGREDKYYRQIESIALPIIRESKLADLLP